MACLLICLGYIFARVSVIVSKGGGDIEFGVNYR
jgi:hypothetical protein